jgi:hypothetical protein
MEISSQPPFLWQCLQPMTGEGDIQNDEGGDCREGIIAGIEEVQVPGACPAWLDRP